MMKICISSKVLGTEHNLLTDFKSISKWTDDVPDDSLALALINVANLV